MSSLFEKKLSLDWAVKVIPPEKRMFGAILYDLQEMGKLIASELTLGNYPSIEAFLSEHEKGQSPMALLEGGSKAEDGVMVLEKCPMGRLLGAIKKQHGGKLPKFYLEVVTKYTELYKNKGAVIHPFCIVHQVIRAQIGENMTVAGNKMLVYQIACRSLTSGRVVFANEGMSRIDMNEDDVRDKIGKSACMYLIKH